MPEASWRADDALSAKLALLHGLMSSSFHSANNDLAGIVTGLELAGRLASQPDLAAILEDTRDATLALSRRLERTARAFRPPRPSERRFEPLTELLSSAERLAHEAYTGPSPEAMSSRVLSPEQPVVVGLYPWLAASAIAALIRNGWEAGSPEVLVTGESEGNSLVVTVTDQGEGIPGDRLHEVVEPFVSSKPHPHWGLGLTQALSCVARHNGALTLVSRGAGQGTRATLFFEVDRR